MAFFKGEDMGFKKRYLLSVAYRIQKRWKRLMVLFLALVLLFLLVKPASYTITHFDALNCGSLTLVGNNTFREGRTTFAQDTQCFLRAHQQCVAASLEMLDQGVDTATQTIFRTANSLG